MGEKSEVQEATHGATFITLTTLNIQSCRYHVVNSIMDQSQINTRWQLLQTVMLDHFS